MLIGNYTVYMKKNSTNSLVHSQTNDTIAVFLRGSYVQGLKRFVFLHFCG